jgi:glc operon protein GlcG
LFKNADAVARWRHRRLAAGMTSPEISALAERLIAEIEKRIPGCMENPIDRDNSRGNVTVFIVAGTGQFFGRMFGDDRLRQRGTCRVAWQKATQVWLTNLATGRYEELVYAKKLDPSTFGIAHPDFIGWDGGLPVVSADGTRFAVAMSGFSGETDCAIIRAAVAAVPGLAMAEVSV